MHHPPEPDQSPTQTDEPAPAQPQRDFPESQDDPQQAEELERQQDA